jgi:uncharacterized protein (UPF0332 family)
MFDALDFLDLAKELKSATDEAKIRTSIGRAYYAAFLYAREWLRAKGWSIYDNKDDHYRVLDGLKKYKGRALMDKMKSLRRDYRNEADYNLSMDFIEKDASVAISLAQEVIKGCSS